MTATKKSAIATIERRCAARQQVAFLLLAMPMITFG